MRNYSRFKSITFENKNGVGTVTLNRPDHMNAFTHEMHVEFEDVMIEIGEDKEVRAVVLTGAGKAFCAGGDLSDMRLNSMFMTNRYHSTRSTSLPDAGHISSTLR